MTGDLVVLGTGSLALVAILRIAVWGFASRLQKQNAASTGDIDPIEAGWRHGARASWVRRYWWVQLWEPLRQIRLTVARGNSTVAVGTTLEPSATREGAFPPASGARVSSELISTRSALGTPSCSAGSPFGVAVSLETPLRIGGVTGAATERTHADQNDGTILSAGAQLTPNQGSYCHRDMRASSVLLRPFDSRLLYPRLTVRPSWPRRSKRRKAPLVVSPRDPSSQRPY